MCDTRTRGLGGLDPAAPLASDPAVKELAGIFADAHALRCRLGRFRNDHLPRCSCACCAAIRELEAESGGPPVRDCITMLHTALGLADDVCESQRPKSADELREMIESAWTA